MLKTPLTCSTRRSAECQRNISRSACNDMNLAWDAKCRRELGKLQAVYDSRRALSIWLPVQTDYTHTHTFSQHCIDTVSAGLPQATDTPTRKTKNNSCDMNNYDARRIRLNKKTRNAWQSLAYSPLGTVVSPPSEYLWKNTYWSHQCITAPPTIAVVAELSVERIKISQANRKHFSVSDPMGNPIVKTGINPPPKKTSVSLARREPDLMH